MRWPLITFFQCILAIEMLKGFYHIWAWQPSWSCDLDFLYMHWFPLPIDASYKIWLWLAKRFQRRSSLKVVDDDGDGWMDTRCLPIL